MTKMKRNLLLFILFFPLFVMADSIDELEKLLREKPQVQEKIYVHTDNSCYFIGDTLWYKAYVVRSDNLLPTDLSKLLYVELLNPDGIVVERQHVVINQNSVTCGQFALPDSLYSGYYEVRAYTRWQLNFNVTERDYTIDDRWKFYSKQLAKDFFRDYEGLYSRVVPVYSKPTEAGNYVDRYMLNRPKQRVLKDKDFIVASFYPEGGNVVDGLSCNMAFEVTDNHGKGLEIEGKLSDGTVLKTRHLGRGSFVYTPQLHTSAKASFMYNGKNYTFNLPKIKETGASLALNPMSMTVKVSAKGVDVAAYSVMCRGQLVKFERLNGASSASINIKEANCPTGVNEIILYDSDAQPLASRLFFINNHDYGKTMEMSLLLDGDEVKRTTSVKPYAQMILSSERGADSELQTFSVAVRDAQTDDRGYNDGNIMTDMLLSSELKGFVANPAYYFASEDEEHLQNLDLLMRVQGWRRYKRVEEYRYMPERSLTFEGVVGKLPDTVSMLEIDDLINVGEPTATVADFAFKENEGGGAVMEETIDDSQTTEIVEPEVQYAEHDDRAWAGRLRKQVLVEAELEHDGKSMGAITRTDKAGRFKINLPAYYDKAILFVKAYDVADSLNKCMQSKKFDKHWADERSYPDYFVRRDMFFPIYSQKYSWYQINSPELLFVDEEDDEFIPEESKLAGNHTLQTVVVKARRRGKRSLDMTKPAIVRDAYELYNDITDYGLSFGVFDIRRMPLAVSTLFFGNMGRMNQFNIRALLEGTSFFRNYTPNVAEYDKPKSSAYMFERMQLKRLKEIRVFTDYELRTDSGDVLESSSPDVTLDFVPLDDDAKRYTYRDRRYVLDGITYPEEFYSPDYSQAIPEEPKDYRRTLYWNPNAKLDADGRFSTIIYNNCRETRVTISAAGLDANGQMYYR